jgi:hypothetical protein
MVMCKLTVLSAQREAERVEDQVKNYRSESALFNTVAYSWVMAQTDVAFDQQHGDWRLRGAEDYIRIIGIVCTAWFRTWGKQVRICQDHIDVGKDWMELVIANRIKRRLEDVQLLGTKAEYLFKAHHRALNDGYPHTHPRHWVENGSEASGASDDGSASEYSDGPGEQGRAIEYEPMPTADQIVERDFEMRMIQEQLAFEEDEDGDIDMGAEEERVRSHRLTPPPQPLQPPVDRLVERLPSSAELRTPVSPTHTPVRAPRVEIPHRPVRAPRVEVSRSDTDSLAGSAIHSVRSSRTRRDRSPPPESSESDSDSKSDLEPVAAAPSRRHQRTRCDPIAETRHDRDLHHYRDSHFAAERRRLAKKYDIVTELSKVGRVHALGDMAFRVKNNVGVEVAIVRNAVGYALIGERAMFYRLKT